jgi:hypothetical protein
LISHWRSKVCWVDVIIVIRIIERHNPTKASKDQKDCPKPSDVCGYIEEVNEGRLGCMETRNPMEGRESQWPPFQPPMPVGTEAV